MIITTALGLTATANLVIASVGGIVAGMAILKAKQAQDEAWRAVADNMAQAEARITEIEEVLTNSSSPASPQKPSPQTHK